MGMLFGLILGMSRKIEEKDESTENNTDTPQEPTDKETETNDTDLIISTEEEPHLLDSYASSKNTSRLEVSAVAINRCMTDLRISLLFFVRGYFDRF